MDDIAGVVHRPDGRPQGVVALTHGAGGSREAPLLQAICEEWARRGWVAVRYNLPYRRRRPKGPPPRFSGCSARYWLSICAQSASARVLPRWRRIASVPTSRSTG